MYVGPFHLGNQSDFDKILWLDLFIKEKLEKSCPIGQFWVQ